MAEQVPEHVERVAGAIDPQAFSIWYHAPRGLEFMKPSALKAEQNRRKNRAYAQARAAIAAYNSPLREVLEVLERRHCKGATGYGMHGEQDVDWCDICSHLQTDIYGHADDCPFAALTTPPTGKDND